MDEIDIWRTASIMLRRYAEDAAILAARRADALLDLGDVDGFRVWKRVVAAIHELGRVPDVREPLNQSLYRYWDIGLEPKSSYFYRW